MFLLCKNDSLINLNISFEIFKEDHFIIIKYFDASIFKITFKDHLTCSFAFSDIKNHMKQGSKLIDIRDFQEA